MATSASNHFKRILRQGAVLTASLVLLLSATAAAQNASSPPDGDSSAANVRKWWNNAKQYYESGIVNRCEPLLEKAEQEELAGRNALNKRDVDTANRHFEKRKLILKEELFPCLRGILVGNASIDWEKWCADYQKNVKKLWDDINTRNRKLKESGAQFGCSYGFWVKPGGGNLYEPDIGSLRPQDHAWCKSLWANQLSRLGPGPFPLSSSYKDPWRMTVDLWFNKLIQVDCRHPGR